MTTQPNNQPHQGNIAHRIAINAFRGGNKGHIVSQPLEEYDKLTSYPWLHQMVEAIRGGDEDKKRELPFRSAHYAAFRDNHRRQRDIIPEAFLYQTSVDIDEKDLVDTARDMALLLNEQEWIEATPTAAPTVPAPPTAASAASAPARAANPWHGMLLHMEYSARRKLHIDIRMPVGMTIEETQRAYCQALGVPCDESCFSPERIIFVTDRESEIYRSPMWYAILPGEERAKYQEAFRRRGLAIDGRKPCRARGEERAPVPSPSASQAPASQAPAASSPTATDSSLAKQLIAFDLFQEHAGLKGVAIDAEGSRHSSLLAIMSAGASRVMTADELARVVARRMPSFAQEHDCRQLISDFYERYGDGTKPMSRDVIRINAEAERRAMAPGSSTAAQTSSTPPGSSTAAGTPQILASGTLPQGEEEDDDYPAPPPMPSKLPALIGLLTSRTPEIYKPAVACAVFPSLAAHLWRTTFRYIDNVSHEATLMNVLMAGTGAGKDCVSQPINYIMADIRQRDRENLAREKAWKDEMTRKGANKEGRKRPDNLIIQEIDADMTNPAFVMRTAEAQEHFLYAKLNEIDQFDALKGSGDQQFRIMCLAFDPGNQYGQTRVGLQSVTERVTVRFNWNACTTIRKGQRYFARVLTDGPVSRISFCTIPEREIGAEMPVYGTYGDDFAEQLRPYIDNLCKASGLVECPEAYRLAGRLKDENADFARMTQSRIYENLSFRANVIGYLKACVLYVASGCRWEEEMEHFVRWSVRYDLWCKMRFFGDAIAKAENEGVKSSKRGPRNLLQLLPDVFGPQEAVAVRLENGLGRQGTRHMLNVWASRGYIRRIEPAQADAAPRDGTAQDGTPQGGLSHSNHSFGDVTYQKLRYRSDGVDY